MTGRAEMEFIASDYPSFRAFKKKYRRELFKSCLGTLVISPGVPILFTLYGKLFGKDADFLALLGMASAVQLFFISHWVWIYHQYFKLPIKLDSTGIRAHGKQISLRDIATVEVVSSSHISLIDHTGKLIRGVCVKEVGDLEEFLRVLSSLKPEIKIIRK